MFLGPKGSESVPPGAAGPSQKGSSAGGAVGSRGRRCTKALGSERPRGGGGLSSRRGPRGRRGGGGMRARPNGAFWL